MIARFVTLLGARVDRVHIAHLDVIRRWPLHGMLHAIAWRFDGSRLTLVHVPNPNMRDVRPRTLVPRSTKKHVSNRAVAETCCKELA